MSTEQDLDGFSSNTMYHNFKNLNWVLFYIIKKLIEKSKFNLI